MTEAFISKTEFARLVGVHRSAVSRWIKEKKLDGQALVLQEGRCLIRADLAKEQLRARLDIGQRFGNGINTNLAPASTEPSEKMPPPVDPVEEQIKRERLETLQRQNRRLAEEEKIRAGLYVRADDVETQIGRVAGRMKTIFDAALADIATAIAARFKLPQRDVLHLARAQWRSIQEAESADLATAAAAMPELVDDEAMRT
jgi:predicted transcriptional regulator